MNHRDAEIASVTIVIHRGWGDKINDVVAQLKGMGVEVFEVNCDCGVIEGSCDSSKVHAIEKLDSIEAVRRVFTYVADFPPGDPRNLDPDDEPTYAEEER